MDSEVYIPRRCQLITPANSEKMIRTAARVACDSVVFDLEDAVPEGSKALARATLRDILPLLQVAAPECCVRINALNTPWWLDDLLALVSLPVHTVILPKAAKAADIQVVSAVLEQLELRTGAKHSFRLQALIESAAGVESVGEIMRASPRCTGAVFGAADFAADVGCAFEVSGIAYARSRIPVACAAAGLQAIDMVYPDIRDHAGLRDQAQSAFRLGYQGKWAIHPDQVPVIQACFTPSAADMAEAHEVLSLYDRAKREGLGAVAHKGKLVDEAVARILRRRLKQGVG